MMQHLKSAKSLEERFQNKSSMKYLNFYDKLNSLSDKEYMEMFLLYSISPVISHLKPASTITIKKKNDMLYNRWIKYGKNFIAEINLKFTELRENNDVVVLMIYDSKSIEECVSQYENNKFLTGLGYKNGSVEDYIDKLKVRYAKYHCPHELGLFLGIPIKDVKDFIDCSDKKCLICGYWKVYNDFELAQEMFEKYDKIKEHTMDSVLCGNTAMNITRSIREYFYYPIKKVQ
jgi:hypothetical protein